MRHSAALFLGLILTSTAAFAQAPAQSSQITVIYFVRHGEVDPTLPTTPLSAGGMLRASVFARTVTDVHFTHVFSSHTTRARQMVEPVAQERQLPVRQLPVPGTRLDGEVVSDSTPSKIAIAPIVEVLRALPPGSSALVGVNSDNIYALLNGLGVPVGTPANPCTRGSTCVPCLTNACFPGGDDQLWVLLVDRGSNFLRLIELRYGVGTR